MIQMLTLLKLNELQLEILNMTNNHTIFPPRWNTIYTLSTREYGLVTTHQTATLVLPVGRITQVTTQTSKNIPYPSTLLVKSSDHNGHKSTVYVAFYYYLNIFF